MRLRHLALCVLLLTIITGAAAAQGDYPIQRNAYVNDYANILDSDDETRLQNALSVFAEQQGIEMSVVTIRSYASFRTGDSTFEAFASGLYNAWGIDDGATNDGILFLTAVEDRQVRIEVGAGYGATLDDRVDDVIDETITPAYRRGDYVGGIIEGTEDLMQLLTGTALNVNPIAPQNSNFNVVLPLVIVAGAVVALYWAIRRASAWGEGIGYDDGYFDADEYQPLTDESFQAPSFWGSSDDDHQRSWNWGQNHSSSSSSGWSSRSSSSSGSSSSRSSRSSSSRGSSRGGGASGSW